MITDNRNRGLREVSKGNKLITQGERTLKEGKRMYAEGTELMKTDRAAGNKLRHKARAWIEEGWNDARKGELLRDEGQRLYDDALWDIDV